MELDCFHIAKRDYSCIQRGNLASAIANDSIGCCAVNSAKTTCGDNRGGCYVCFKLTCAQVAGNYAQAPVAVVNQGFGLHTVMNFHAKLQHTVIKSEKHRVARAVGSVAGAPFCGAAKGAGMDEAFIFRFFSGLEGLATLVVGMFARHNPVPGNAHIGHFAHGNWRSVGKNPGYFLIAAPVRALYRIIEMNFRGIAVTHDRVAECGLHAALGS